MALGLQLARTTRPANDPPATSMAQSPSSHPTVDTRQGSDVTHPMHATRTSDAGRRYRAWAARSRRGSRFSRLRPGSDSFAIGENLLQGNGFGGA